MKRKKKKGFTLIELVIVLAVLAIIALIAIPNFTKIRNKSLVDADYRAAESIEKITLMAIANGDLVPPTVDGKFFTVEDEGLVTGGTGAIGSGTISLSAEAQKLFRDANGPQLPTLTDANRYFKVEVTKSGDVTVGYVGEQTFNGFKMTKLAGLGAAKPVATP